MTGDQAHGKPDGYWDRAGEQGYGQAMYRSSDVESHVRGRVWQTAIDIAGALGVPADGHVLDLGCGDGAFANQMLAGRYRKVEGIDKSEAAIKRANAESRNLATYRAVDLVTFDYDSLPRYDAAFLIGILHHVKQATPDIVRAMAQRRLIEAAPFLLRYRRTPGPQQRGRQLPARRTRLRARCAHSGSSRSAITAPRKRTASPPVMTR